MMVKYSNGMKNSFHIIILYDFIMANLVEKISLFFEIGQLFTSSKATLPICMMFCFSGETDEDFEQTINLIKDYKFPQVHISQFYPRPGTAAKMKKVPSIFESFRPYVGMENKIERIWITDVATDGTHLVGHTKGYIQVLVVGPGSMLGSSAVLKITSVGRWSVFGDVIEILTEQCHSRENLSNRDLKCSNDSETCCSKDSETFTCEYASSCGQTQEGTISVSKNDQKRRSENLIGRLLRKRKNNFHKEMENDVVLKFEEKQRTAEWAFVDSALLAVMLTSLLTAIAICLYLGFGGFSSK